MVKHPFFQNSLCLNSYLHRFKIEREYDNGVLEVCEICKVKKFFKVIDDKLDNQDYMSWHFSNVLPSNHPFYYHENEYNPYSDYILSPYV